MAYWYILYDDLYMIMRCHKDTEMLRSTTSPYGRTCVEAAYGETMIHSIEAILGDVNSGRVVEVSS